MNRIPDDCLIHIFQYISPVERLPLLRVCRLWKNLLENRWPERKLQIVTDSIYFMFTGEINGISVKDLLKIIKLCGGRIRKLDLYICNVANRTIFVAIGPYRYRVIEEYTLRNMISRLQYHCRKLDTLNVIINVTGSGKNLRRLLQSNTELKTFIYDTRTSVDVLPEFINFSVITHKIENLIISNPMTESHDNLLLLLEKATKLKVLIISMTELLNDEILFAISQNSPALEILLLRDPFTNEFKINDPLSIASLSALKNLRKLCLDNVPIKDEELIEIVKNCTEIEHLILESCKITLEGLITALKYLRNLETLELIKLHQVHRLEFSNPLEKLLNLKLEYIECFEAQSLIRVIYNMPVLSQVALSDIDLPFQVVKDLVMITTKRNQKLLINIFKEGKGYQSSENYHIIIFENKFYDKWNELPVFLLHIPSSKSLQLHIFNALKTYVSDTFSTDYTVLCYSENNDYVISTPYFNFYP